MKRLNIKMLKMLSLILICILLTLNCSSKQEEGNTAENSITFEDLAGRTVTLKTPIKKMILIRSRDIYEFAAVLGEDLPQYITAWGPDIKTSDKDAYEKYAAAFPSIKKIPEVGNIFKDAISTENILSYNPDLVVMEKFMMDRKYKSVDRLIEAGLPVVILDMSNDPLKAPQKSIRLIGKMFGREERAERIIQHANEEINKVTDRLNELTLPKPKVYLECGYKGPKEYGKCYPGMENGKKVQNSWGALLDYARADNIVDSFNKRQGTINPEYLLKTDPDIIYITAAFWPQTLGAVRCGYYADKKTSTNLLNAYLNRPGWNTLKAVKEKKVYTLFHGFTMHIYSFSALQHMAKALYPEVFSDLDPEANFIKFHNTFFPVAYSGVWMTELKRENEEEI